MKATASEDLEIGKVYDTSNKDHLRLKYLGVWFFPAEGQEVKIFKPMDRETGRYFIHVTHPTLGEVIPFPIKGSGWYEVDQN